MTCEVAVMNKRGVALAADSAVTLGDGEKIYHTAEKLFQLSASAPVGIMIYGNADMMGVPWETVIKIYSNKLDGRRFDHIADYAEDFLRFIETSVNLFPASAQTAMFRSLVSSWWRGGFLEPLQKAVKEKKVRSPQRVNAILKGLIAKDNSCWKTYPHLGDKSMEAAGEILKTYGSVIDEIEKELFGEHHLSQENRDGLRQIVKSMYGLKWVHPNDESGIVIVGMGEAEAFPALVNYTVGTIANGKLRYFRNGQTNIGHEASAAVAPFAQTDMIDMLYDGIYPELEKKLVKIIGHYANSGKAGHKPSAQKPDELEKEIRATLRREIMGKYKEPLMAAVDALPRYDLAKMAEALVSLTAMQARMSTARKETVGGPVDVAIISKGEGFVWVKRKNALCGDAAPGAFCASMS